ncbi:hypothetical protein NW752_010949 [Fusarium irregulare]|uniref:Uncharacterized protein n=1 Tax=Fusarium irregulare TaxID=2494466 RepID=A0A9W8PEJ4_9HYPO|nr:hypothetical protein NW766_011819 [Fusarium irregulare]KAJ4006300.1 hypothetical protein NW752_010949 [Fusarium irregulare]
MDYETHVVGESTDLASSHQTVEARGSPRIASWDDSAYQSWCTIYELFEARRRSANRYLNKYFDCLDRIPTSSTELNENGVSRELSNRWGSEAETNMWRLKISHDTVVQDLKDLIEILDKIKEQEEPQKRPNSPALTAWTIACSILTFVIPHKVSSSAFQIGALAGALLFTVRLLWKPSSLESLDPVQYKLQALLQSFEEGTMQYHDRSEVLIAELNRKMY